MVSYMDKKTEGGRDELFIFEKRGIIATSPLSFMVKDYVHDRLKVCKIMAFCLSMETILCNI